MNPYVLLALGIAWLGSVIGVGWWQRHDGATVERTAWQERANTELASANAEILRQEQKARADEARHAADLAAISQRNLQEKRRVETQHLADLAALDARTLVLRDPGAAPVPTCGDPARAPGAGPGGRDAGTAGGLSDAAARFLLGEAARADAIAQQLRAAQAVIVEDRRLCGAPP